MNIYERYPSLKKCEKEIDNALKLMLDVYNNNGKVLVCGNGGSCADCEHIVGELMKGFLSKRKPDTAMLDKLKKQGFDDAEYMFDNIQQALPAISLPSQSAIISAFANDVSSEMVYAQLVYGYAAPNDLLICISTSGNSKNVVYAAKMAKALNIKTLALTGERESALSQLCDVCIRVPEVETYKVQELHLPVYHYLCAEIEKAMF